jgi:hypothetical protein
MPHCLTRIHQAENTKCTNPFGNRLNRAIHTIAWDKPAIKGDPRGKVLPEEIENCGHYDVSNIKSPAVFQKLKYA